MLEFSVMKNWMIKAKILGFALLFTGYACGQRINMIDIIGNIDSVSAAFVKSGLKLVAQNAEDYRLTGKMAGENIELRFYFTPISRVVFKGLVITEKSYPQDSLHGAFLGKVEKISKRYITPETLILSNGSSLKYQAQAAQNPSNQAKLDIPVEVQKIAWENMVYFTNLKLYCYKRADGKICTEYVVKDNEIKYNNEKAMTPNDGKLDLGF